MDDGGDGNWYNAPQKEVEMATGSEFLRLRFTGARFEGGAVPYDAIKDIAALQKMAVEVAKWQFREEHPKRRRLPNGFPKDTDWAISRIEDGSAVPIVSLTSRVRHSRFGDSRIPHQDWLERARDIIFHAIDSYHNGHTRADYIHMPREYLGYFRRFGRSLRDGERLELSDPNGQATTFLTKNTRRRILATVPQTNTYMEDEVHLRGFIFEADQQKMSFQFQEENGARINIDFREDDRRIVMDALAGYTGHKAVEIHGVGVFNSEGEILCMESVDSIEMLDPLNISQQLDDLRAMRDGWLDGDGIAPPKDGLDWLQVQFQRYYPDSAPRPYIYPTFEGGVEIEWTIRPYEIGMTVDLSNRSGEWSRISMEDDAYDEQELNMNYHDAWAWIVGELRRLSRDYQ